MKPFKIVFWTAGIVLFAALFALLFELARHTAYAWSCLDDHTFFSGIGAILKGDLRTVLTGFMAGLLPGLCVFVLAVAVRAFWTIRIGKRTLKISALAVMLAVSALALAYFGRAAFQRSRRYHEDSARIDEIRAMLASEKRICHAAGAIIGPDGNGYTYTNSLEAFNHCLEEDVRFVELDFRFTSDGELVCIHKWKMNFVRADGTQSAKPVSLEEFRQGSINGFFTPMTLEDVAGAMRTHPDLYIVLDLKGDSEELDRGYRLMAERYPDLIDRLIPQFYHASEYERLRRIGYRAMIYTLYKTQEWERSESVLNAFAMREKFVGITMGIGRAMDDAFLGQVLKTRQPVYANTIDKPRRQKKLYDRGVSAVYTNVIG